MRRIASILMVGVLLRIMTTSVCATEPFSWESQSSPPVSTIYTLYNYAGSTLFAATDSGIYQRTPQGSWQLSGLHTHTVWTLNADSQGYLFAGVSDSGIYRSTDRGQTWNRLTPDVQYVRTIIVSGKNLIFAGTYYDGVYRSSDGGKTWTQSGLQSQHIRALYISSKGALFAGTDGSKVYRSSNDGTSWQFVGKNLESPYVWCFTEDASQQIFAGTSDGIYISRDGGSSWIQTGLKDRAIWSMLTTTNNEILASAWNKGVFMSQDDGKHWINIGLKTQEIWDFTVTTGNTILACSNSGEIFKLIQEPASVVVRPKPDSTAIQPDTAP